MSDIELFLCSRYRNIRKTSFLLNLIVINNRLENREYVFLHSREEHDRKLKSLCGVNSHKHYRVRRLIVFIDI